ncbi:MAG: hypothetical protein JJ899_05830 [Alphaproteobacteria bacterium]|nr:hypothetical protein [Alphaproteobacteria bacterium]
MKFLDQGKYELRETALLVEAEHDGRTHVVEIDRNLLEDRYGVTATGEFHEYWDVVLQNREELQRAAEHRAQDGDNPVRISMGDLSG